MKHTFRYLSLLLALIWAVSLIHAQDSEAEVAITLERTACFGTCPIYSVTIYDDGTVVYNGVDFVDVIGEQTSQIDPETVALMVEAFVDAGYFEWDDAYTNQTVSDLPSVITSVSVDGDTKQINRYNGDMTAPLTLPYLELWIDKMVNTQLWVGNVPSIANVTFGEQSPIITLSAGACFGFCPIYDVALFEDGTIIYMGIANVDTVGVQVIEQDPLSITSIADIGALMGYFDWEDSYEERLVTDQVTVTTSVSWQNQYKQIIRYDGDPSAPIGLVRFEDSIRQLVSDLVG